MMMFRNLIKDEFKFLKHDQTFRVVILISFILILFLKLIFPLFSNFVGTRIGFRLDSFYTIIAITFISVLPVFLGYIFAVFPENEHDRDYYDTKKFYLYTRVSFMTLICFLIILITIVFTDPVPSEGWLRTVFVSFLFSTGASIIFFFIGSLSNKRTAGKALSVICLILLITIPVGLMVHHPWNYLTFISPFYWVSWAWISNSSAESLCYGAISLVITTGLIIWTLVRSKRR
jgi:hypothetical protein